MEIALRGEEKEASNDDGALEQPLSAVPELAADEYPLARAGYSDRGRYSEHNYF